MDILFKINKVIIFDKHLHTLLQLAIFEMIQLIYFIISFNDNTCSKSTILDVRLVQWNLTYSGWLYALLELNKIIESPMTYSSGSGEDGLSLAKNYISLMSSILKWKPESIRDFEPLIGTVIVLIKR